MRPGPATVGPALDGLPRSGDGSGYRLLSGAIRVVLNMPREADCRPRRPAGLQGFFPDYLREADRVVVPLVPSIFDMAATEDTSTDPQRNAAVAGRVGIVAMRVDPRTKATTMLEGSGNLKHIPIVAYLRNTQNYVNAAAGGATIFDPPRAKQSQGRPNNGSPLALA